MQNIVCNNIGDAKLQGTGATQCCRYQVTSQGDVRTMFSCSARVMRVNVCDARYDVLGKHGQVEIRMHSVTTQQERAFHQVFGSCTLGAAPASS